MGRKQRSSQNHTKIDRKLKTVGDVTKRRSSRLRNKITGGRLSIPAGFFSSGAKSAVVKKKPIDGSVGGGAAYLNEISVNRKVLEEDLHGLLQPVEQSESPDVGNNDVLRRRTSDVGKHGNSKRVKGSAGYLNVSDYYLSLFADEKSDVFVNEAAISHGECIGQGQENITTELSRQQTKVHDKLTGTSENRLNSRTPDFWYTLRNENFCADLRNRIKIPFLKRASSKCLSKIRTEIEKINNIVLGKMDCTSRTSSGTKRPIAVEEELSKTCSASLIPQSQWVYNTPDKQNMKNFVFEDGSTKFLPAVFHTSKKTKALYDIKNEYVQQVNFSKFEGGEKVPIDRRYLKTICENTLNAESEKQQARKKKKFEESHKENVFNFGSLCPLQEQKCFTFAPPQPAVEEYNMFLSKSAEETINIGAEIGRGEEIIDLTMEMSSNSDSLSFQADGSGNHKYNFDQCCSAVSTEPFYEDVFSIVEQKPIPMNYEHQLLMATQRPGKNSKKIQKRHLLKAKSLSFENTPPGAKVACFEPKKLLTYKSFSEDGLDQFEKEFEALNTESVSHSSFNAISLRPAVNAPHTVTSGALSREKQDAAELFPSEAAGFVPGAASHDELPTNPPFSTMPFSYVSYYPTLSFYPRRNYDRE